MKCGHVLCGKRVVRVVCGVCFVLCWSSLYRHLIGTADDDSLPSKEKLPQAQTSYQTRRPLPRIPQAIVTFRPTPQLQIQVEIFPNWTNRDPHDTIPTRRLYLYSAIVALHGVPANGTEIHFVTFQDGRRPLDLMCCARISPSEPVYSGHKVSIDFPSSDDIPFSPNDVFSVGRVYRCWFPFEPEQFQRGRVTLSPTTSSCPRRREEYLRVHHPVKKTGGLAICAKISYGFRLDPEKLLEWFEIQRLLGVDKIQLFDFSNTEIVYKIFQHYQNTGLLDLLLYKLPGRPWGRSLLNKGVDFARFGHDEELSLWDCRLRLAGYDYVMDVDTDEVIMPRQFMTLKPFLMQQFPKYPKAASLQFKVQFFLDHWAPVKPEAPLLFLRYLNSTYPRPEVSKHVYIPGRTHQCFTHLTFPYKGYVRMFCDVDMMFCDVDMMFCDADDRMFWDVDDRMFWDVDDRVVEILTGC
ncbi:hypothetical protein ACOMHN_060161 [Nucella lapillus]